MKDKFKRWLLDLSGFSLIVLGISLGWLPGPGGIPLVLAGLGLLAINNKWAENILMKLRDKGQDLVKLSFPDNKKIQLLHDIGTIILLTTGLVLIIYGQNKFLNLLGIPVVMLGVSEFLFNRDRLGKIKMITLKLLRKLIDFFKTLF